MAKGFAIDHSMTDHGGIIRATQMSASQMGSLFLVAGDGHFCPKCKCWSKIIKSHDHIIFDGKAVAYVGDQLTCGAKILPKQDHVVGDSQGSSLRSLASNFQHTNSQQNLTNNLVVGSYNMIFLLKDGQNKPLTKMPYTYEVDGISKIGTTDDKGCTDPIQTNGEKVIKVYIGNNLNNANDHGNVLIATAKSNLTSNAITEGKTNRLKKPWKISDTLRQAMIKAEGAIPREYPSPEGGNNTIGIGHKIKDSEIKSGRFKAGGEYPQPLSMKQMLKLKDEDVGLNGGNTLNQIVNVPLHQYEMDAIIDLCFNGGKGALSGTASTLYDENGNKQPAGTNKVALVDLLNSGKYSEVPKYLRNHFNTSNRMWSRGVQNRRNMDARMFVNAQNGYIMLNDAPKKK